MTDPIREIRRHRQMKTLTITPNREKIIAISLFKEAIDRMLEAERDVYHHSGTDTPEYNEARERRDRFRDAIIKSVEDMIP